jgi:putative FmdB family regulatory protein
MPVYEYYCGKCDCRFERHREVSQRASCPCPKCGRPARKGFRPVGIVFKGSGFHVTDYPTTPRGREGEDRGKPGKKGAEPERVGASEREGGD